MKKTIIFALTLMLFAGCSKTEIVPSPFDADGYRYVYDSKGKFWKYYGPDNKKIANIYYFDNGPDYYSNGLRRIVENEKIGFIDKKNQIVIPPQFDYADPFKNGFSPIAKNPIYEKVGEHTAVKGGKWGLINKKGVIVLPMKYDSIYSYSSKEAIVVLNKKNIALKLK